MLSRFLCVVVCVFVCASYSCALYSNSWAVEVIGGDAVADALAKKHGVINLGKVRSQTGQMIVVFLATWFIHRLYATGIALSLRTLYVIVYLQVGALEGVYHFSSPNGDMDDSATGDFRRTRRNLHSNLMAEEQVLHYLVCVWRGGGGGGGGGVASVLGSLLKIRGEETTWI